MSEAYRKINYIQIDGRFISPSIVIRTMEILIGGFNKQAPGIIIERENTFHL